MELVGERKSSKTRKTARKAKEAVKAAASNVGGKITRAAKGAGGKAKSLAKRGFKPLGYVLSAKRGILSFGFGAQMLAIGGGLGWASVSVEQLGVKNGYVKGLIMSGLGLLMLIFKPRSDKWKGRVLVAGTSMLACGLYAAGQQLGRNRQLGAQSTTTAKPATAPAPN